ncbi:ribosomal RNA small subunit methyltransferase A [Candidatus Nomurabacteria bacterium RIFCSPLOWO2_01_FULL_42_17]|uniref:Ribosomal RNA small subunit methyltransferase A n=1 Tax=Candidatus Nomurabacteria bacterium RIFCSPLOWO2_01_FULL_42_17 TaxID=1801780 RepID=A0A1F6XN57_9BACT|nr:MAG: ribosomal RNA small subunit methyltransferase A [Candidatus Nomurabacteria bacterium RIFCSPLOWO2_01_FULL_42_17]
MHQAKKSLGQNFLKSEIALRKIIEAGEIKSDDVILEIGPGRGALTKQLLACSCQLVAVEKDKDLCELLQIKFQKEISSGQLKLIQGDILEFDLKSYNLQATTYKLIANIPYNITGAILKKFLTAENQPSLMVLMVQHEVAQRIIGNSPSAAKAKAGKKESILSISVKAYGEPKMIMKVDKRYFSPAPKVNSAIISIKNISRKLFTSPQPSPDEGEGGKAIVQDKILDNQAFEEKFWEIVKKGFAHKRKKLSSNLKDVCQGASLTSLGNKRAEDLALADWIALTKEMNRPME